MKTFGTVLSAAVLSFILLSAGEAKSAKSNNIEMCSKLGTMAKLVMELRQKGTSPSQILSTMKGDPYESYIRTLVSTAYKKPRYMSQEMQMRSVQDFQSEVETMCFDRS